MKRTGFLGKVAARFVSESSKRRKGVKMGGGERLFGSRKARLEALESRELLAADALSGALEVLSSDSEVARFAEQARSYDVAISFDLSGDTGVLNTTATETTWTVTSNADSETEGTLRYAINNAAAGDRIVFDETLKGATITLSGTQLEISKSLTIDASNLYDAETQTPGITIDANQQSRVMYVKAPTQQTPVVLNGLTLQNGKVEDGYGGGICLDAGALTITNTTISENSAKYGGGVYASLGTFTATNATISENSANAQYSGGGGVWVVVATFTATNVTISENSTQGQGGGVAVFTGGVFTSTDVTISGNTANTGGGVYVYKNGSFTSTDTTISENTADATGGGVMAYDGSVFTSTNTTISENSAKYYGGGVYVGGTVTSTNTTISGNSVQSIGSGVYVNKTGTFTSYNTCVVLNQKSSDVYNIDGATIQGSNNLSTYTAWTGSDNYVYDSSKPLFVDAENGDYRLAYASQAIDKGSDARANEAGLTVDSKDLAGESRFYGNSIDIGAYECQEDMPVFSTVVNTLNDSFDLRDDEWSLREAIYYLDAGSTITFAEDLNGTITLTQGELVINKVLTIDGDDRITIDADQKSRVMNVAAGTSETPVVLNGLTLQNGKLEDSNGGAGIYLKNGALTVTNATISGNSASFAGGGIYVSTGSVFSSTNTTISGNSATQNSGGGIYVSTGSVFSSTNTTISGNTASSAGGGVYVSSSGTFTSYNTCVILNNGHHNVDISNFDGTIQGSNNLSTYTAWTGDDNYVYDSTKPLFVDAENGDYRLAYASQAIDKGSDDRANEAGLTVDSKDLAGKSRFYGKSIDIGAYECQEDTPVRSMVDTLNDSFDLGDDEWSLREAIYYLDAGSSITFAEDLNGTITLTQGELFINKVLTINGDNRITIDANQQSRVMNVTAGTSETPVVLNGLTLQNGKVGQNGGGIYLKNGTLTVTNTTISGNTANNNGGGVYIEQKGSFTSLNSTVAGNTAHCGGGVYVYTGTFTSSNTTISGNVSSTNGGGVLLSYGTFTATNTTISGNSAQYCGGGVHVHSNSFFTSTNTTISGNTANNGGSGVYVYYGTFTSYNTCVVLSKKGADVGNANGTIQGSNNLSTYTAWTGDDNYVYDSTKPLFVDAENGDYRLAYGSQAIDKGSDDRANEAGLTVDSKDLAGEPRFYGKSIDIGAYECQEDMPVYSTVVDTLNDSFDLDDGEWSLREALYYLDAGSTITFAEDLNGKITLTQGELVVSKVLTIDGDKRIMIDADQKSRVFTVTGGTSEAPVHLKGLTITGGKTTDNGGGIYSTGVLSLVECSVVSNAASLGGGVYSTNSLTVLNSTFDSNGADGYSSGYMGGGAIYAKLSLSVDNSTFTANSATNANGGGGAIASYYATATISNSSFSKNFVYGQDGGAVKKEYGSLSVVNCEFTENTSQSEGGAFCLVGYGTTITESVFTGNSASANGGAIYVYNGSASATNCNFSQNTANRGGALYTSGAFSLTGSSVESNTANYGGGVYINSGASFTSINTTILNNKATNYGGGVHIGNAVVTLTNSLVFGNTSYNGAGVYIVSSGSFTSTNTTISNNTASSIGGGVYAANGSVTATNTIISRNIAKICGGVEVVQGSFTSVNTTITGNSGSGGSGVRILNNGTCTSYNSIVALNTASEAEIVCSGSVAGTNNLTTYSGWTESGNYEYDATKPLFADAANGDYRLAEDSQAINKGSDERAAEAGLTVTSQDLSGGKRFVGASIDVGAYEFQRAISLGEYEEIRAAYPELNLPENVDDVNVVAVEAKNLSVAGLKAAIAEAGTTTKGDLIVLRTTDDANTITFADAEDEIKIDVDSTEFGALNIVAFGSRALTLDAAQQSRAFNITSGTVGMANLTITGGKTANEGGGICLSQANLTVVDVTISGNTAELGGGVYNVNGVLTTIDTTIANNEATNSGGVLALAGSFTSTDTTISNNTAKLGGGVFVYSSSYTSTNTSISGNTSTTNGGGVFVYSNGSFVSTNSTITGNVSSVIGGGVFVQEASFTSTNTTISGNSSSKTGCGLALYSGTFTSYNSIVALNSYGEGYEEFYVDSDSTVSGTNNLSTYTGWTESGNYEYDAEKPLFADAENGDYRLAVDSQAIDRGSDELAADAGLSKYSYDMVGATRIRGVSIDVGAYEYQSPTSTNEYEEIRAAYPALELPENVEDVHIIEIDSTNLSVAGLKAAIEEAGTTTSDDLIVVRTTDKANEIAFADASDELQVNIDSAEFGSLKLVAYGSQALTLDAAQQSRVFSVANGTVGVANLTITNGQTSGKGGGIYAADSLTLVDCSFVSNVANVGGAVYGAKSLTVVDSSFESNVATGTENWAAGGAIYALNSLAVDGSTFEGNYTTHNQGGGGAIIAYNATSTISSSTFIGNKVNGDEGGGAVKAEFGSISIDDCEFSENTCKFGGAVCFVSCEATVDSSEFTSNTGGMEDGGQGGAIRVRYTTATVKDCTFSSNKAYRGSGVYVDSGACTLIDDVFTENAAVQDGGAIYNCGTTTATRCEFVRNTANYGAALYTWSSLTCVNCVVSQNVANGTGGALWMGGAAKFVNCTIAGNVAKEEFGGICVYANEPSLINTILACNFAKNRNYDMSNVLLSAESSNNAIGFDPGFEVAPSFDENGGITNADEIDLRLKSDAWAIDRGNNLAITEETDFGGNKRFVAGYSETATVDIGAYEVQETTPKTFEDVSTVVTTALDVVNDADGLISLREAIFYATEGDTITFDESLDGQTLELNGTPLFVDKALTIDASELSNGFTIDANGKSNVLTITGATTLKKLTITGGNSSGNGGGIYASEALGLIDCSIASNTAALGGGVYSEVSLVVENSSFTSNSATSSWNCTGGGAIYAKTLLTVDGSTFEGNYTTDNHGAGGAILAYFASSTITDSTFLRNATKGNDEAGGAVKLEEGSATVDGCVFSENESAYGGAFCSYSAEAIVVDCEFTKNIGKGNDYGQGGALRIYKGSLTVENSVISGNTAKYGGGVYVVTGSCVLTNVVFSENVATQDGGAVYNNGTTTATRCEFVKNRASILGGALYNGASLTVVNSVVSQNTSDNAGGGVYSIGETSETKFVNSTVAGNMATVNVGGLYGLHNTTLTNTIVACNFSKNMQNDVQDGTISNASSTNAIGFDPGFKVAPVFDADGVLTNADTMDLRLKSDAWGIDRGDNTAISETVDLDGNPRVVAGYAETATVDVGAYEVQETTSKTFETASTVVTTELDVVDDSDGLISLREAIYYAAQGATVAFDASMDGKTLELNGTQLIVSKGLTIDASNLENGFTIDGNQKSNVLAITDFAETKLKNLTITGGKVYGGGGIWTGAPLVVENCTFKSNEASIGGGIYSHASLTVINSTFESNLATGTAGTVTGGAIYAKNFLSVTGSTFTNNSATHSYGGGGAIAADVANSTVTNSIFTGNKANSYEGGAIKSELGSLLVDNCQFQENEALRGAALFSVSDVTVVKNSLFSKNKASNMGGAVYSYRGSVTVNECDILDNTATDVGGGIYIYAGSLDATNVNIQGNYAYWGGGIHVWGGTATIKESQIIKNSAYSGGGLLCDSGGAYIVNDSTISENTATNGGGLRGAGTFSITNTKISNNTVTTNGGGIDLCSGTWTLVDSEISGNTGKYGGGIYGDTGTFTSTNTAIVKNISTEDGGGIYGWKGTFSFTDTTISENSAANNAGGFDVGYGTFKATDSIISGNSAAYGGGVKLYDGTFTAINTTISNNTAAGTGGGVDVAIGTFIAINSTISGNTSDAGGGVYVDQGTFTATNTTISGNTSTGSGGGIDAAYGKTTLINSQIVDNNAKNGGGVFVQSGTCTSTNSTISGNSATENGCGVSVASAATFTFYNSIVALNASTDLYVEGTVTGANNLSTYTGWGDGNYEYDATKPLFRNAEEDDYRLAKESQAIDRGSDDRAKETGMDETWLDVAGKPRFNGDSIDIGAYEFYDSPNEPGDLTLGAYNPTTRTVAMTWQDNSDDETGFRVEYSTDGGKTWRLSEQPGANATSRVAWGVKQNATYDFRVCALKGTNRSEWVYSETLETKVRIPQSPSDLTLGVYDATTRTVSMTWQDNSDNETGFRVEYSTDGGKTWRLSQIMDANATSRVAWSVKPDSTYTFRVCALLGGLKSKWAYSEILDTSEEEAEESCIPTFGVSNASFDVQYLGTARVSVLPVAATSVEQASVREVAFEDFAEDDAFAPFDCDVEFVQEQADNSERDEAFAELFDDDLLAVDL